MDIPYLFFFSYSRADWEDDLYLERFFTDLERQVAVLAGAGRRTVGFRDEHGVKTGEDWNTRISGAVQTSNVLVCIYTANFFSAERVHEFCAKEFTAFLKRDPDLRYDREVGPDGRERHKLRDGRNILPVLWLSEHDLTELNKLPPYAVGAVKYALNGAPKALNEHYQEKGMSLITTNRKGTYRQILAHLARRIIEWARTPLPSIAPPPEVGQLRNAFWDPPEPPDGPPGGGPPGSRADPEDGAAGPSLGPRQVDAFEIRHVPGDGRAWEPFPGAPSLRVLVEEIAQSRRRTSRYRTFDPGAADFVPSLKAALTESTKERVLPILFVAPEVLANPGWRAAIRSLLREQWRGGLVVPVNAADRPSVQLIQGIKPEFELTPNEREWIVIREARGGLAEFRTAVISVADDILALIVKHGSVERPTPATDGPSVRPRVANTVGARQAQP